MSEGPMKNAFGLGFGLMRLPKLGDGSIDVPQVCRMADRFLEAGGTYFDTAYVYDGGMSEAAFRAAVADRYPRERYVLATKLNARAKDCHGEEDAKRQVYTSIERTGAGYIDYYLLHAVQRVNYRMYEDWHLWDYVRELKEKGLIKHYGFSFHADPDLLEELLTRHPDAEFVQLQINYADWENPGVASRRNWEICQKHGKPVTIMEPVKGGVLADPIPEVRAALDDGSGCSCAGWALRFALAVPNLIVCLSGASSLSQMEDNLRTVRTYGPLTERDREYIRRAQAEFDKDKSIPCTACRYCVAGCPMNIPIPEVFNVVNRRRGSAEFRTHREYSIVTQDKGRASDCVACGQCESVCPQHLPIIELLKTCRELET